MSATAAERIAQRWDGRADRDAQEYLVRAAGWTRRIVWVVVVNFAAAFAILLTGRLDNGRMIAAMAVPVVATSIGTFLIFRRTREFRGAASIVAQRQGLPSDTYLDFRGVAAFDVSLARARSRTAAR
ncbi:hypothetical protein DDP54_08585 [Cellulomonas sp. WB94]|uniref:hypothetical protein n=1 Tax=Cellulomonas sp. WB94 TaxID=2173174 RepID=UPI000D56B7C5|nr:hypothetical protein [Cellulomonas sp. WB94]PVU83049.1 hypothetical protein DDP54_08585 [Cellulomonas sp. WB94]